MNKPNTKEYGFYLHSSEVFRRAKYYRDQAVNGWGPKNSEARDAIPAILFSTMSVEAFVNELPELARYYAEMYDTDTAFLKKLETLLTKVEKSQGQLELKLLIANIAISGDPPNLGKDPYQAFSILIKLRNELVHLKPNKLYEDADGNLSESAKNLFKQLKGEKICAEPETYRHPSIGKELHLPLYELVSTPDAAKWACKTAANVVRNLVEIMPESKFKSDLTKFVNQEFT